MAYCAKTLSDTNATNAPVFTWGAGESLGPVHAHTCTHELKLVYIQVRIHVYTYVYTYVYVYITS